MQPGLTKEELQQRIRELEKTIDELCLENQYLENKRMKDALEEIVREEGRVCDEYEICTCRSCRSSYNSWAIASKALNPEEER